MEPTRRELIQNEPFQVDTESEDGLRVHPGQDGGRSINDWVQSKTS